MILFAGYILIFPGDAVNAAARGLLLWYERVLPALLPFAILSNILIYSGYLNYVNRLFSPVIRWFFPVSGNGAFVMLSGFLFGFPMGSKNCAELLKYRQLEKSEADVLFAITNNISPVFISGYILNQQLAWSKDITSLTAISLLILYLPPLLAGKLLLTRHAHHECRTRGESLCGPGNITQYRQPGAETKKMPASESKMNFKIIDAGIMNGFETLTRLGGYIMLFSILASLFTKLPVSPLLTLILTGITEITNGISLLSGSALSPGSKYILAMGFTAFGGLSGIAQTSSMIAGTGLSLGRYCLIKMLLTACTLVLALLVAVCFGL